jgi:hypothetical protein
MIIPTAAEMLKTVEATFETVIKPHLTDSGARSAAASVGHMLRLATLRIEIEGQILHDEVAKLRALLPRLYSFLGEGILPPPRNNSVYPSLALMAAEVGALRQGVCEALDGLQGRELNEEGVRLLSELNSYISWQLDQERKMIDPATIGHGPRR